MAYCPYCGAKKEEDIWDETEDVIREKAGQAVEFVKKNSTRNGYSCREDRRCSRGS